MRPRGEGQGLVSVTCTVAASTVTEAAERGAQLVESTTARLLDAAGMGDASAPPSAVKALIAEGQRSPA